MERGALRRLLAMVAGLAFVGSHFVVFPWIAVDLSVRWGWPCWRSPTAQASGVVLALAALAVFVHCAGLFRRVGHGTPQPLAPPADLVAVGLYRYSRNPIYVADVGFLVALFLILGHAGLLLYAILVAAELHAWVVLREEPVLRQRFGASYVAYTGRVPRWLGRPVR